jgi:transglutaminase-like putative cysteine protease
MDAFTRTSCGLEDPNDGSERLGGILTDMRGRSALPILALIALALPRPLAAEADLARGQDAVLVEERMEIAITSETQARVRYLNRTQVLTARGAERYDAAFVNYGKGVTIRDLHGAVVSPAGKRTEVKRQQIADAAAFESYTLYADSMVRALHFTGVVPGATVEYSYEQQVDNLFFLPSRFDLQEAIPVRLKVLSVQAPAGFALRVPVQGATPEYEHVEKDGVVTHRWTVRDVAPLKRETMLPPLADLVPNVAIMPRRIVWSGVTTIDAANWSGIGRFYWDLAHDRMVPAPEVAEAARALVLGMTNPDDRLRTLFEFVQGKINYVSISLGVGGWQPHANGDVFKYRYGDCKDKATLLIAMLRAVDLEALPVLIRTRDSGLIDRDNPSVDFNHAIVAVPGPDGYRFLDPTDTRTPFGDLPEIDQGVPVVVVKPDGTGELLETPLSPPERNRRDRVVRASLNPAGNLEGTFEITAWGQRRVDMAGFLDTRPSERDDDLEDLVASLCPGAQMKGYEVTPPKGPLDPIKVSIRFAVPQFVTRAAGLEILSPQVVRLPWLTQFASAPDRIHPLYLDYPRQENSEVHLALPSGRTIKKMPADRERSGAGLSAVSRYALRQEGDHNVLEVRRSVSIGRREVPPADFPALRNVLGSLAEEDAAAVTLVTPASGS